MCGLDLLTGSTGGASRCLQRPLRTWRERDGSGRSVPSLAHDLSELVKDRISWRVSSAKKGTDDAVRAQSEKQVFYTEVVVKKASRFLLCRDDHLPGFLREPLEWAAALGFELTAEVEAKPSAEVALLSGLLRDAQLLSDLSPRSPGPASLLDEVAHEVVPHSFEEFPVLDRHGQPLQFRRRSCPVLHLLDEVVQVDRRFALSHIVNCRLTKPGRQSGVDDRGSASRCTQKEPRPQIELVRRSRGWRAVCFEGRRRSST